MRRMLIVGSLIICGTLAARADVDLNVTSIGLSEVGDNLNIGVYSQPTLSDDQMPFAFSMTITLKRAGITINTITQSGLSGHSTTNCNSCVTQCNGNCTFAVIARNFDGHCGVKTTCRTNPSLATCQCNADNPINIAIYILQYCGKHPDDPRCNGTDAASGDTITVTLTPGTGVVDPDMTNNSLTVTVP